jgi:hypothetical protein
MLAWAWWSLLGCQEAEEVPPTPIEFGSAVACIGNNLAVSFGGTELAYALEGEVEETDAGAIAFNVVPCPAGVTHNLQVRTPDGVRWVLGWRVQDRAGGDVGRSLPLEAGTPVSVVFRAESTGLLNSGFVVRDEHGVVGAVGVSNTYKALLQDELADFTVDYGAWSSTNEWECGTVHGYQVDFKGDETLSLTPFDVGEVSYGGVLYDVVAASAFEYESNACQGVGNELVWSAFRRELIPVEPEVTDTGTTTTGETTGGTTTGS